MKKAAVLLVLILFAGVALAQEKVSITYFPAYPHIVFDTSTKKVSGAVYDLLENHIAPKMGVQFVWDNLPSNVPREIQLLSKEARDAAALLIYTPDRSKQFSFTKNHYFISKSVIGVLNSNSLTKIEKVEDILPLKIGYMDKTFISPFMRDERIKFEFLSAANAVEQNLLKLKAGRIDAIYNPDKAALLYLMKVHNMESMVRVIDLPERAGNCHVVFSKGNKALADRYNKAFNEINGEKVYLKLLGKYLDVNRL